MPKVTIGSTKGLVQSTGSGLVLGDGSGVHRFTGDNGDATIPVGQPYVQIHDGGSSRSGMRFASAGAAGEMIVVSHVGGNPVTFDSTAGTCLVRGINTANDTMEANGTYVFISDGTLWVFLGGSEATNVAGLASA